MIEEVALMTDREKGRDTVKSLLEGLPPEVACQVHPQWQANESAYWAVRDRLVTTHIGRWVAFADGEVIAAGTSPVDVFAQGQQSGRHPYVICVGHEDEPSRMRRATFAYDTKYAGEPIPLVSAEFRSAQGTPGTVLDRVIPDTGADASAIPWADCKAMQLDPATGVPGLMSGVGTTAIPTIAFLLWVVIDGQEFPCRAQADFSGDERILGRDVLNRMDVLFRGPSREIVFNP